jgi:hypothetical protein
MHLVIGNAFLTILEILRNAFSKVKNAYAKSIEIHGNAFKKPKLEMHFFPG